MTGEHFSYHLILHVCSNLYVYNAKSGDVTITFEFKLQRPAHVKPIQNFDGLISLKAEILWIPPKAQIASWSRWRAFDPARLTRRVWRAAAQSGRLNLTPEGPALGRFAVGQMWLVAALDPSGTAGICWLHHGPDEDGN